MRAIDLANLSLSARHAVAARWRSLLSKLLLVLLGLTLLQHVSRGWLAPLALCVTTACSYTLGRWLRLTPQGGVHLLIGRAAVPAAFVVLMALNVFGLVGTLTGAQSSLQPGAANAWIAMPFYLLAAAAFVADMAARRAVVPRPFDFLVYMTLPFKLLAGPLEAPALLRQIEAFTLRLRRTRFLVAWPWLAMGAFMKYVIANRLDPARHLVHIDPLTSLATAAIFELKFYFDFAGYSFMAYGAALALGLRISQNFNHPFLKPNVVLFWRAWHMSLGRFLTRYVLEPNLSLWQGRQRKLLFASSIFLVSAMWHGGTLNYLLWGLFHGSCYFIYVRWLKHADMPSWAGVATMLAFFVLGRLLAIDADSARLLARLGEVLDPVAWAHPAMSQAGAEPYLTSTEIRGLLMAAAFLVLEVWSQHARPHRQGYRFMRRPMTALVLVVFFVLVGRDSGALLYARI